MRQAAERAPAPHNALTDVPAVMIGERLARGLPSHLIRWTATALFIATGMVTVLDAPD